MTKFADKCYLSDTHWAFPTGNTQLWFNGTWYRLDYLYDRYAYMTSAAARIQQTLAAQGTDVWVLTEDQVLTMLANR